MVRNGSNRGGGAAGGKPEFDWKLDSEGTLTVTGEGRMPDLNGRNHAESMWQDLRESIKKVCIGEGITEIGTSDFEDCVNLTEVHLPATLTRIRAYAFRKCTALSAVEMPGKGFRYIYDKPSIPEGSVEETVEAKKAGDDVVFGVEAFEGTPWAREYFGGFYCRDKVLYICFSGEERIVIPQGTRRIFRYSFRGVHARELVVPRSLEIIEDFSFMEAGFDKIVMPARQDYLRKGEKEPGFLACAGIEKKRGRIKVPYLYELALRDSRYEGYKQFVIRGKSAEKGEDGQKRLWGRELVDVGTSLIRRMKRGAVLIGIRYDGEHRIEDVKSFVWLEDHGLFNEYLMYPCIGKRGEIEIWRDSFTYQEQNEISCGFSDMNAEELIKGKEIRFTPEGSTEEWFWSKDIGDFGGPLELALLEAWMKEHPGSVIDTIEENIEKDRYRMFVAV